MLTVEGRSVVPLFSSGRYLISRIAEVTLEPEGGRGITIMDGLFVLSRTDRKGKQMIRYLSLPYEIDPTVPPEGRVYSVAAGHGDLDPEEGLSFIRWFSTTSFGPPPPLRLADLQAMGMDKATVAEFAEDLVVTGERFRPQICVHDDRAIRASLGLPMPWLLPLRDFLSWLEETTGVVTGSDNVVTAG